MAKGETSLKDTERVISNFTIELKPVCKKNNQVICRDKTTGRLFIRQNDDYLQYEKDTFFFIPKIDEPIDYKVNVKAVYYVPDRRVRDLANLNSALHDVLVKHKLLKDDKWEILYSTDGSHVEIDKERPRTEVCIERID